MDSSQIQENKEMFHFIKMNIFGESRVGKSTLISWLERYNDDNFKIKSEIRDSINSSIEFSQNLVEQVKKVVVPINKERNIYYLIYETKINDFDKIKSNLDTLLVQTECIVLIWDKSNSSTFDRLPDLINAIIPMINKNVNIYLIENKSDLEFDINNEGKSEREIEQKIESLKKQYRNLFDKQISLTNKEDGVKNLLSGMVHNYKSEKDTDKAEHSVKIPYPMKEINPNEVPKFVNICIIGDKDTGKSKFIEKIEDKIIGDNNNKLELNYLVEICDEKVVIKISDSSWKSEDKALIDTIKKKCHGFLLFFDVTNENSFDYMEEWANNIRENVIGKIIIVANKIDKRDKEGVAKSKGKNFAKEMGCKYFECSCKLGINVHEIFKEICLISYNNYKDNLLKLDTHSLRESKKHDKGKSKCC